jgi:hypothetical protein
LFLGIEARAFEPSFIPKRAALVYYPSLRVADCSFAVLNLLTKTVLGVLRDAFFVSGQNKTSGIVATAEVGWFLERIGVG